VDLYAAADAFCLPTLYETFCLVAHEAAAAGLPLLVGCVSGVDDLIVDGVNGWFITRDPSDLALRLRQLRDEPAKASQMGQAARRSTERYGWDMAVNAHLALYERLALSGSL
jgi:UDP-glucose:(heptosyl)LPS alpha-1,3-glucosyltransferase